jgi:putative hydrolase of the HAD superfamily
VENKSIVDVVNNKKVIMFDLFQTLVTLNSPEIQQIPTYEILGIKKEEWENELFEGSRERLTGKIKEPFQIIKSIADAINPHIQSDLIIKTTNNRLLKFEKALMNVDKNTINTLKALKSMNKKIGLISNADFTEMYGWNKSPLKDLFDYVVFSCEVGSAKPDKEIYEICLKELNGSIKDTVFIGDGASHELYGAKQIGLTTIMITGFIKDIFNEKEIESRKLHADYVIDNINELIE